MQLSPWYSVMPFVFHHTKLQWLVFYQSELFLQHWTCKQKHNMITSWQPYHNSTETDGQTADVSSQVHCDEAILPGSEMQRRRAQLEEKRSEREYVRGAAGGDEICQMTFHYLYPGKRRLTWSVNVCINTVANHHVWVLLSSTTANVQCLRELDSSHQWRIK